jgi:hypothetical protein
VKRLLFSWKCSVKKCSEATGSRYPFVALPKTHVEPGLLSKNAFVLSWLKESDRDRDCHMF